MFVASSCIVMHRHALLIVMLLSPLGERLGEGVIEGTVLHHPLT
jgi:hypothetical protein